MKPPGKAAVFGRRSLPTEGAVTPFPLQPLAAGIALDRGWRAAGRGVVERDGEPLLVIDLHALIPGGVVLAA